MVFAGVGLIHTLCPGEYYECAILFDRPYLGVSSMHFDILLPGIYVTQFLLHGSPFGFQQTYKHTKLKGKINIPAQTFNLFALL